MPKLRRTSDTEQNSCFAESDMSVSDVARELRIRRAVVVAFLKSGDLSGYDVSASGVPFDPMTLGSELAKRGKLEAAGGVAVIAEVCETVPHSAHIRFYIKQLQTLHQRDALRLVSEQLKRRAEDPTSEPSETTDTILNNLEAIRAGNFRKSELISAADALESFDRQANDPACIIQTGLPEGVHGSAGTRIEANVRGMFCFV